MCKYRMSQPVVSRPSPSRSSSTTPASDRSTSPAATAVTQAFDSAQPPSSAPGAKSSAACAPPSSQAPCGPPVSYQVLPPAKGSASGSCVRSGGTNGSNARANGSPNRLR